MIMIRTWMIPGVFAFVSLAARSGAPTEGVEGAELDDESASSEDAISLKRSKRDYCCIVRQAGTLLQCKRQRDYRDELGRINARATCEKWFVTIGTDGLGGGSNAGDRDYDLVSANCNNRDECSGTLLPTL